MDMEGLRGVKSLPELSNRLRENPDLARAFGQDPTTALDAMTRGALPNTLVYRIVVSFIGAALLISLLGAIALVVINPSADVPDILISAASASVGALSGLLAPQPDSST